VLTVILAVVILLVLALIVVPRASGAVPLTVLSGSMRPTVPEGSVVVVREVAADDLKIGDVITYQIRSGDPTLVTHRIVGITVGRDGPTFRTRGDANDAVDPAPVVAEQVKGRVWYHVPFVGRFTGRLDGSQRGLAVRFVATALFAWSAWLIAGSIRDRMRAHRGSAT
jgi:signal peptidase I